MRRRHRRGFLLVLVLLISAILLVTGMALLTVRSMQSRGATLVAPSVQARLIAEAGLDDAKVKLEKDLSFPPSGAEGQQVFTWSEDFYDLDGRTRLGRYTVSIDASLRSAPYCIYRLTSIAVVGAEDRPSASRGIYAELDLVPNVRGSADPNPTLYRFVNWQDLGGY